jgi:hypothetical protein
MSNAKAPAPRWRGAFPGIPIPPDKVSVGAAPAEELAKELAKVTDPEVKAAVAERAGHLAGVGIIVKLPFFTFAHADGIGNLQMTGMPIQRWPEHEDRAYPVGVAVDILAGPENPLRELPTRIAELRRSEASAAAAAEQQAMRARAWSDVTDGWSRIGGFARTCLRAASTLPVGPPRDALVALATGAVEEMLAGPNAPAPALDEQTNAVIRSLGRTMAEYAQPQPHQLYRMG